MLIEFRVENHRSLRDEQVITMEAGRVGDDTDVRPRHVTGHAKPLLTVAALYGANASGKSNVLAALAFLRDAVVHSHRSWSPDDGVPRDPFAWGAKREEPSLFEVTMHIEGVRFEYGFVASNDAFLEEWLYAWPHGKKQVWLERDENGFKFGDNLKGENRLIEQVTRPNALFLSVAAQHNHDVLSPMFRWFRRLRVINLRGPRRFQNEPVFHQLRLARLLEEATQPQQSLFRKDLLLLQFLAVLRNADVGIVDLKVIKSEFEGSRRGASPRFHLRHQSDVGDAWLPLEQESGGTQTLFRIALPILLAIEEGGVLIVDELEANLHPSLASKIIRQFNDPETNPRNAQILFTTHDTNLLGTTLGEPAVRRDQVWLTEKDEQGASVVYPLTDYTPRKMENLERGYLQGRYGAIPFLDNFTIASAE